MALSDFALRGLGQVTGWNASSVRSRAARRGSSPLDVHGLAETVPRGRRLQLEVEPGAEPFAERESERPGGAASPAVGYPERPPRT